MSGTKNSKPTQLILNEETLPVIGQVADQMPGGFFIYHADGDEELIYVNAGMPESGMNSHIAKPFETDNLVNTIKSYIKK